MVTGSGTAAAPFVVTFTGTLANTLVPITATNNALTGGTNPAVAVTNSVQNALQALPSIGSGNVTVSGSGTAGSPFVVTFTGALTGTPASLLSVVGIATAAENVLVPSTGGDFNLTYNGQSVVNQAYNVTAATLQTNLQALSSIGTGNAAVTLNGTTYTVTLSGSALLPFVGPLLPNANATGGTVFLIGSLQTPINVVTNTTAPR